MLFAIEMRTPPRSLPSAALPHQVTARKISVAKSFQVLGFGGILHRSSTSQSKSQGFPFHQKATHRGELTPLSPIVENKPPAEARCADSADTQSVPPSMQCTLPTHGRALCSALFPRMGVLSAMHSPHAWVCFLQCTLPTHGCVLQRTLPTHGCALCSSILRCALHDSSALSHAWVCSLL